MVQVVADVFVITDSPRGDKVHFVSHISVREELKTNPEHALLDAPVDLLQGQGVRLIQLKEERVPHQILPEDLLLQGGAEAPRQHRDNGDIGSAEPILDTAVGLHPTTNQRTQQCGDLVVFKVPSQLRLLYLKIAVQVPQLIHTRRQAGDEGRENNHGEEQRAHRVDALEPVLRRDLHRGWCELSERPVERRGVLVERCFFGHTELGDPRRIFRFVPVFPQGPETTSDDVVGSDDQED
mmetsp:Transcript_94987/g.238228  ORF Transcript_94987/g.238228 Transcript_94987/m.238228 type:complete len:238 (-) Transcript_94987:1058-1771(-)